MNKLKYLIESMDIYEVQDSRSKGSFSIQVNERKSGVHFNVSAQGVMLADSPAECAELLKELVQVDCYNKVVRKGEKEGQIKVSKNVTANVTKLDKLIAQRDSILPQKNGDTA